MCTCLQQSEKKTFDFVYKELTGQGKLLSANEKSSKYQNTVLTFKSGVPRRPYLEFAFHYTPKKKDGTPGRPTVFKQVVIASYCPFCGDKYPEDQDDSTPVEEDSKESHT